MDECELDSYVGSEALTAVVMNGSILWQLTPCSSNRPLTPTDYTEYTYTRRYSSRVHMALDRRRGL
jgi:hypothetical protein